MSFSSCSRAVAFLTVALAVAGCKEPLGPDKKVETIEISPKSARLYSVGQEQQFTTELTTEAGTAGEGIEVGYIARDKTLLEVTSSGVAKALKKGGSTYVVVTAGGKSDSAFVEVPLTSCGTVAAATLTVGQVVTDIGATGFCAASSTGSYTVMVHNNSLSGVGTSTVEVTGIAVGTPPTNGATFSRATTDAAFGAQLRSWRRDVLAEMRFRRAAAAQVQPLIPASRAWYANRAKRASFTSAPPVVGDIMPLNLSVANSCSATTMIDGRVAAVSNTAIVVADPRNPTGGFTDAEYNEFAQMFDTVISPLDITTFGGHTDLDNNGRVLLIFTKAVNDFGTSSGGFASGLFHPRDLVPKSVCAASNQGEMFYIVVPDPAKSLFKADVQSLADVTIAHEFQHLINSSRRTYINSATAQPSEELWLNEGLSSIAEELLYYRRTSRSARTNLGLNETVTSQAVFVPFRDYMGGDFILYDEYVFSTAATSPFSSTDGLGTRGGAWSFLRYVADHRAATDGSLWYDLVNSGETGTTNLRNRLGITDAALRVMLRDFTIAVYTDDYVLGVPAKYTHPSWNMRSIYPGLQNFFWPMELTQIEDGEAITSSIQSGGFRVYRFRGIAGADAFIRVTGTSGSALPAGITISVVRTQ